MCMCICIHTYMCIYMYVYLYACMVVYHTPHEHISSFGNEVFANLHIRFRQTPENVSTWVQTQGFSVNDYVFVCLLVHIYSYIRISV